MTSHSQGDTGDPIALFFTLDPDEQLATILAWINPMDWLSDFALDALVIHRATPIHWARIEAQYRAIRGDPWGLRTAVDARIEELRNAAIAAGEDSSLFEVPTRRERARRKTHASPPLSLVGGLGDRDDTPSLPYSDMTNAFLLVEMFGSRLRYCHSWGKWVSWTGTNWTTESPGEVVRCAQEVARALCEEGKRLLAEAEAIQGEHATLSTEGGEALMLRTQAVALLKHAKSSCGTGKIQAMCAQAQVSRAIEVGAEIFAQQPWLLNCPNGTIDLRSGELLPHTPTHYLMDCLKVPYDPAAHAPRWERFLLEIMRGNQGMVDFLQRAIGYALTGITTEQVFFILWGEGANGKSTFLNTLLMLFGSYGMQAMVEMFLETRFDRHPTEKADLFGKRFISAVEVSQSGRLNESLVKTTTGGDIIRARRMREDFWQFLPTHHFFLATNYRPSIRGTDEGIWRRVRLIPFLANFSGEARDQGLGETLLTELPGILAWAVRGCLAWQQQGLQYPEEVLEATQAYREEEDILGLFLAEYCTLHPRLSCPAALLYQAYAAWCEENGLRAESHHRLWGQLAHKGIMKKRGQAGIMYVGVGVNAPQDDDESERASDLGARPYGKKYKKERIT